MAVNGYLLNGYCAMPSPFAAEIYARQGWDTVTIDMEHGSIGFDGAVAILQAITASGVVPLVRIPKVDAATIGMLLDAGALGITCAMINTAAEALELVRACKYPPRGIRSLSRVTRAALVYGPDYNALANEFTNVFAMIETAEGLANLDDITAVDGIDGIYVGSVDLAMSVLGRFPPATGKFLSRWWCRRGLRLQSTIRFGAEAFHSPARQHSVLARSFGNGTANALEPRVAFPRRNDPTNR